MKNRKDALSTDQRSLLNSVHKQQIVLEIALIIFILSLFTINVSSAIPGYGAVVFIGLAISSLVLFIIGIILTQNVFSMKNMGKPLSSRVRSSRAWLLVVWWTIPGILLVLVLSAALQNPTASLVGVAIMALLGLFMLVAIIVAIININLLWRRFNKNKRSPIRPIVYGIIAANMLLLVVLGSYTTTEAISHASTPVTDANLELGQSEVRQAGRDGEQRTKHNLIFGFAVSTETDEPVDEIVANGSRRYQYMHCSNGSYRYYDAEQFKNPTVGFTHQSPDYCAQNGQGTQTTIADTPPAEKIIQQVPTYYPTYRSPSSYTTTCSTYSFSNDITCRTY